MFFLFLTQQQMQQMMPPMQSANNAMPPTIIPTNAPTASLNAVSSVFPQRQFHSLRVTFEAQFDTVKSFFVSHSSMQHWSNCLQS